MHQIDCLWLFPGSLLAHIGWRSVFDVFFEVLTWGGSAGVLAYEIYRKIKGKNEKLKQKRLYIEQVESQYRQALLGTDRAKALELGRLYYSHKHWAGILTIYDEQALNNDLSTMR